MSVVDHAMSTAVREAYARGEDEERLGPLVRVDARGQPVGSIRPRDVVVFYDIRGEREVELTQSLVRGDFAHFAVRSALELDFTTMIEYEPELPTAVAFPPLAELTGTLCEVVGRAGRRQVKITETEKAAHLGFFFNGKRKTPFPGEERVVFPSPRNPLAEPEMCAGQLAEALTRALEDRHATLVIGNLPNIDVVGHSEDRQAIRRAIEAVDRAVGRALAAAQRVGAAVILTADHGSAECWLYPDGTIDTGHTTSRVPCRIVLPAAAEARELELRSEGGLSDVAPTVLALLGLAPPATMTGRTLFTTPSSGLPAMRVLLLICDGWGIAPPGPGNLIAAASTPTLAKLQSGPLFTTLAASGAAVGLAEGTVGNSEAGHLHLGAGRLVPSDRVRIDQAIADGGFFKNRALVGAMERARDAGRRLHLLGIVSFFSSHGAVAHLFALLQLARRVGVPDVCIHGLLGRRGERKASGANYVEAIEDEAARLGVGRVASLIGRHWALDREQNWDRVERAYRLLVEGVGRPVA